MSLKEKMEAWFEAKSLNQEKLAELVDVPQATVSGWVNGARPHRPYLRMLREAVPDCPILKHYGYRERRG